MKTHVRRDSVYNCICLHSAVLRSVLTAEDGMVTLEPVTVILSPCDIRPCTYMLVVCL
jgi:hypothetical protein